MTITRVQVSTLIDLARYCADSYDRLEPYTSAHDEDFKPPLSAFGGAPGAGSMRAVEDGTAAYPEPVYRFVPMTVEEYEKTTGTTLDRRYDPRRIDEWGRPDHPDYPVGSGYLTEVDKWQDFYAAGGRTSGGTSVTVTSGGDAPWAVPLKTTWDDAVDDRLEEVAVVRDELDFLMGKLIRVADRYPEVDLENAVSLEKFR